MRATQHLKVLPRTTANFTEVPGRDRPVVDTVSHCLNQNTIRASSAKALSVCVCVTRGWVFGRCSHVPKLLSHDLFQVGYHMECCARCSRSRGFAKGGLGRCSSITIQSLVREYIFLRVGKKGEGIGRCFQVRWKFEACKSAANKRRCQWVSYHSSINHYILHLNTITIQAQIYPEYFPNIT